MARKKVNLQWIANDKTRRATFKKRCAALMKKTRELTTLCGVKVCVVVYEDDAAKLEVSPSIPEARRLLKRYKAIPDELENLKKAMNMEEYLRSRISKLREQMCKSDLEKRKNRALYLLHEAMDGRLPNLVGLTNEELASLEWVVESKMRSTKERFEQLGVKEPLLPLQEQAAPSSHQHQAPFTTTEMQTLAPVQETQAQQEDWFVNFAQNGGELSSVVYGDLGGSSGTAGPSSSGAGADTMQYYNMWGSGFSSGSWDPLSTME
ncbi:hypothetical protein EJB05_30976, partial [Eragrostis curvula]